MCGLLYFHFSCHIIVYQPRAFLNYSLKAEFHPYFGWSSDKKLDPRLAVLLFGTVVIGKMLYVCMVIDKFGHLLPH